MSIVTRKRSDNYAIIPNAVAEDSRLSFEARGLLVYLLAKPHDWQVRIGDLRKQGLGRDRAYRLLDELGKAGYLERTQVIGKGGQFGAVNYTIYDDPVPSRLPLPENPEAVGPRPENQEAASPRPEKPHPEKPHPENQDALIRTHIYPKPNQKSVGQSQFGELWQLVDPVHRPEKPGPAAAAFDRLPADIDRTNAIAFWKPYRQMMIWRGKKPNLMAYLRERTWRELNGAPPFDSSGLFVITPDREEWQAWIDAIRATYGTVQATTAERQGKLLRETRFPPASSLPAEPPAAAPQTAKPARQLTLSMETGA